MFVKLVNFTFWVFWGHNGVCAGLYIQYSTNQPAENIKPINIVFRYTESAFPYLYYLKFSFKCLNCWLLGCETKGVHCTLQLERHFSGVVHHPSKAGQCLVHHIKIVPILSPVTITKQPLCCWPPNVVIVIVCCSNAGTFTLISRLWRLGTSSTARCRPNQSRGTESRCSFVPLQHVFSYYSSLNENTCILVYHFSDPETGPQWPVTLFLLLLFFSVLLSDFQSPKALSFLDRS